MSALLLVLSFAPACGAEEEASVPDSAPSGRGERDSEEDYADGVPWLQAEVAGTLLALTGGRVKAGTDGVAVAFDPYHDAGLPLNASFAAAAYLDVKVFEWASIGGFYWGHSVRGPKRTLRKDLGLGSDRFPAGTQRRTRLDLQHAEISLRYVWTHTERVHLWFGLGASWFSYRIGLRGDGPGRSTRVDTFFAPALTYAAEGRVPDSDLKVFLVSGIAVSYRDLPSTVITSRFGFRYELFEGLSLSISLSAHNGFITRPKGLTREDVTDGYRHRRVRWTAVGLELGLRLTL